LILLLKDLCIEISILRSATPVILLVVNPHMHINIWIPHHFIISYDRVNSYDLKDQIIFQIADRIIWTFIDSHQLNNFIYVILVRCLITSLTDQCTLSWSGSLVVFAANSLMMDSDLQIDNQGSQNLRKNERKGENGISREMVVLLKWNLNN